MKKFIVNEVSKKIKGSWKWLCRVFLLEENGIKDITEKVSELTKTDFDGVNLTVNYWSWTGAMVIETAIRLHWWGDMEFFNMSIF